MTPSLTVGLLWLVFGGTHVGLATRAVRGRLVARLGENGFSALYSVVAVAGFVALVGTYAVLRDDGAPGVAATGWFRAVLFGVVAFGWLTSHAIARDDGVLLAGIAWFLVGTALLGVVVMPLSGFWLVLVVGALMLRAVPPRPCNATERAL